MQKDYKKICSLFFREAEMGNWKKLTINNISKRLKKKEEDIKKIIPNKNYFLSFYNKNVDYDVIKSVPAEELKISSNDEIIQEYFMQKLEIMNIYKFGFINILNVSLKDPSFLLINLQSNKTSIDLYVKQVSKKENNISRIILTKLLLATWLIAFNKWLYDDSNTDIALVTINKGISRIKKNTDLFNKI